MSPWIFLSLISCSAALCSCASHSLLKAGIHKPTASFQQAIDSLHPDSGQTPFALTYHSNDVELIRRASARHYLYIAPVRVDRLTPIDPGAGLAESTLFEFERPSQEVATELRIDFYTAFLESNKPRYQVLGTPREDGLTLTLSLVELDPTAPLLNLLKFPLRLISPFLPFAVGSASKGSVAIEGILRENDTGGVVFAFADREKDQISLFSIRDYTPYGHTPLTLRYWAQQFEEYTRTNPNDEVEDSLPFRFNPF